MHVWKKTGHKHNFEKKDNDLVETFDLPYDYDSLMHYPNDAFVKPGKNLTIISKARQGNKGQTSTAMKF